MMRPRFSLPIARRWASVTSLVVAASALLAWQSPPDAAGFGPRLERLDPSRPSAYFELAEEVADVAVTKEDQDLARTLFALAGALDREGLGRSSALALATLAEDPRRRRALMALAVLLSNQSSTLVDSLPTDSLGGVGSETPSVKAAVDLSEAFSHFRRGQGPRAASITKAPEVDALLVRYGTGSPGGADRFREDCRVYKGGLRPSLTADMRTAMLSIEEAVLASAGPDSLCEPRSWSSVLIQTSARPLIEIDAAKLDSAFGVDVSRPYWRGGRWVEKP